MNWIGGARSRIKIQGERKQQKEYFERKKFQQRTQQFQTSAGSSKRTGINLDLLSMRTISKTHREVENDGGAQKEERQVNKVDLDLSIPRRTFTSNLELPNMSPIRKVSRLQLEDKDAAVQDKWRPLSLKRPAFTTPAGGPLPIPGHPEEGQVPTPFGPFSEFRNNLVKSTLSKNKAFIGGPLTSTPLNGATRHEALTCSRPIQLRASERPCVNQLFDRKRPIDPHDLHSTFEASPKYKRKRETTRHIESGMYQRSTDPFSSILDDEQFNRKHPNPLHPRVSQSSYPDVFQRIASDAPPVPEPVPVVAKVPGKGDEPMDKINGKLHDIYKSQDERVAPQLVYSTHYLPKEYEDFPQNRSITLPLWSCPPRFGTGITLSNVRRSENESPCLGVDNREDTVKINVVGGLKTETTRETEEAPHFIRILTPRVSDGTRKSSVTSDWMTFVSGKSNLVDETTERKYNKKGDTHTLTESIALEWATNRTSENRETSHYQNGQTRSEITHHIVHTEGHLSAGKETSTECSSSDQKKVLLSEDPMEKSNASLKNEKNLENTEKQSETANKDMDLNDRSRRCGTHSNVTGNSDSTFSPKSTPPDNTAQTKECSISSLMEPADVADMSGVEVVQALTSGPEAFGDAKARKSDMTVEQVKDGVKEGEQDLMESTEEIKKVIEGTTEEKQENKGGKQGEGGKQEIQEETRVTENEKHEHKKGKGKNEEGNQGTVGVKGKGETKEGKDEATEERQGTKKGQQGPRTGGLHTKERRPECIMEGKLLENLDQKNMGIKEGMRQRGIVKEEETGVIRADSRISTEKHSYCFGQVFTDSNQTPPAKNNVHVDVFENNTESPSLVREVSSFMKEIIQEVHDRMNNNSNKSMDGCNDKKYKASNQATDAKGNLSPPSGGIGSVRQSNDSMQDPRLTTLNNEQTHASLRTSERSAGTEPILLSLLERHSETEFFQSPISSRSHKGSPEKTCDIQRSPSEGLHQAKPESLIGFINSSSPGLDHPAHQGELLGISTISGASSDRDMGDVKYGDKKYINNGVQTDMSFQVDISTQTDEWARLVTASHREIATSPIIPSLFANYPSVTASHESPPEEKTSGNHSSPVCRDTVLTDLPMETVDEGMGNRSNNSNQSPDLFDGEINTDPCFIQSSTVTQTGDETSSNPLHTPTLSPFLNESASDKSTIVLSHSAKSAEMSNEAQVFKSES